MLYFQKQIYGCALDESWAAVACSSDDDDDDDDDDDNNDNDNDIDDDDLWCNWQSLQSLHNQHENK